MCKNPLYLKWIREMLNTANKRKLRSRYILAKAYNSLRQYPEYLNTPSEAIKVEFVGRAIVKYFERKHLTQGCKERIIPTRRSSVYIPRPNSNAYNILTGLATSPGFLSENDLLELISKKTAKAQLEKLLCKGYIEKIGSLPCYSLTKDGTQIVTRLKMAAINTTTNNKQATKVSLPCIPTICMEKGTYHINLVIDSHESKAIGTELYTTRLLTVGDAIFIANCQGRELVLDIIVERKTVGDLLNSIKDGRYENQKNRMPEGFVVIYIIEDQEGRSFTTNEIRIVNNAIASIQINDGICVQRTQNANATLNYLQLLHETIRQKYTGQLYGFPDELSNHLSKQELKRHLDTMHSDEAPHFLSYKLYSWFGSNSASQTVGDTFVKMLMSIKGVSQMRASVIQNKYLTLAALYDAYTIIDNLEEQRIMVHIGTQKKISQRISNAVYDMFFPEGKLLE